MSLSRISEVLKPFISSVFPVTVDNKIPALFEFLMQGGFMILANLLIPVASFPAYIILIVVILSKQL